MQDLLMEILERSSSVYERRGTQFVPPEVLSKSAEEEAAARMTRWKQQGPKGNEAYFSRRLGWDGLDEASARRLLARPTYTAPELPAWILLLQAVFEDNRRRGPAIEAPRWSRGEVPIAFEDILLPFVAVAGEQLSEKAGHRIEMLSRTACIDLERSLAATLSLTAERTLYSDFAGWREMPELAPSREAARPVYSSYVASMRNRGLENLCRDYPVLARLLSEIARQWVVNTLALLGDLEHDRPRLAKELFHGQDPGVVEHFVLGISDRHHGGKTVIEVQFQEQVCFYKPRDCRPEQAFNGLLAWLGDRDERYRMSTYRVIACGSHGWVEKVPASGCEGEPAARRFFERCGALTAVLYALEASDCNFDNILISGDCPVLIDAETLLQPRPRIDEADTWKALGVATEEMYYDSVLRLHILPQWIARPLGEKADVSGLGAGKGNRGASQQKIWSEINTDAMSLRWDTVHLDDNAALKVTVAGQAVATEDFLPEIVAGFEGMYRLLIDCRDELWAEKGPMRAFLDLPARIVVRNTFIYVGLLHRLYAPTTLRDGADASIALDQLSRLFSDAEERPRQWPLVEAECAAMFAADIPYFHAHSCDSALQLGTGKSIRGYFREPASVMLPRRFFQMSAADLDLQKRYIRSSFGHFEETRVTSEPLAACAGGSQHPCTLETSLFEAEALRLARAICAQAVRAGDGTISWITQTYNADSQFRELKPIGLFLYDGIGGIALFLAALGSVLKTGEFAEITLSIQTMLCDVGLPRMRYHLEREAVGAGLGTASLAYCLARIAVFRQDDSLLDAAFAMARSITTAMVKSDRRLDLIGGTAGCLLVLHSLHSIRAEPWLQELALACGEHLLAMRSESPQQLPAWRTIRSNYLAGFSHGAAGIGCALAKLYEWTSDARFRVAAQQAVTYEETLYSAEENNWPNLLLPRKTGGYDYWNSWCHGAPGIGLSRLLSRHALDGSAGAGDLDRALAKTGQMELSNLDSVCCGNFGRIDLLIEAASVLDSPEHLSRARAIATAAVRRAKGDQDYVAGVRDGIYVPSFHQGMAGIGYQLLRLSQSDRLPAVMAWQ